MEPNNQTSPETPAPEAPPKPVAGPIPPAPIPTSATQPPQPAPVQPAQPAQPYIATPVPPSSSKRRWPQLPKKVWALIAGLLLIGGAAAFYFGYYMNPSVIYSQSLKNTGKGYDKLMLYLDAQEKIGYKGSTGSGTYKFKSPSFSTDGKLGFKSDDKNAQFAFDIGLGATRLETEVRAITSTGETPDIYLNAKGLKGLGSLMGIAELDEPLAKLDDSWIVIDHTLIENLSGRPEEQASSLQSPTPEQIIDGLKAFGRVNQEYLYSTDEDKAVLKVVKTHGKERVASHDTYHYEVAIRKDNLKKYVRAQHEALKSSKLGDWVKQNKFEESVADSFKEMERSVDDDIKDSDTFDMWVDTKHRLVYKVRLPDDDNPAENYVDLGLDYNGGDTFPFFLAAHDNTSGKAAATSLVATLDTKTGSVDFRLIFKSEGKEGTDVSANFKYQPSNESIKIAKPAHARPLAEVLSELGYGDLLTQLQEMGAAASAGSAGSPETVLQ